jgi:UDP-glucuronate 4-epimerase
LKSSLETYHVFITGVAGFIGSHVAESLLKSGARVFGVDNLNDYYSTANKKNNIALLSSYKEFSFSELDITSFSDLEASLSDKKIKKIAHIAARAGVRPSISDPLLYQKVNVEGSLNVLEMGRRLEVENFVLTSSSSVYGDSDKTPFKEDDTATDRPISPYAATKKASEVLAHTYHHLYKMPISIIRPFTVFGPRGRPDMAPWLFLESALKGKPIRKFGDGTSRRDYTYIDDFVDGFTKALEKQSEFEIFNLGNSNTVSLNEAISIIEEVTGKTIQITQMDMQPGDVKITNADIEKANNILGYNPSTSYKEGMEKFHSWFTKENQ